MTSKRVRPNQRQRSLQKDMPAAVFEVTVSIQRPFGPLRLITSPRTSLFSAFVCRRGSTRTLNYVRPKAHERCFTNMMRLKENDDVLPLAIRQPP